MRDSDLSGHLWMLHLVDTKKTVGNQSGQVLCCPETGRRLRTEIDSQRLDSVLFLNVCDDLLSNNFLAELKRYQFCR